MAYSDPVVDPCPIGYFYCVGNSSLQTGTYEYALSQCAKTSILTVPDAEAVKIVNSTESDIKNMWTDYRRRIELSFITYKYST